MSSLLHDAPDGDRDLVAGRYRLHEVVGTGGVAVVVRATDELLDRTVAVKLLRESTDNDDDRARFVMEAATLGRLSHPGLVTVLDAGTCGDRAYLVMELVDGAPLSQELSQESGEPVDLARLAGIGAQVASALAYAHDQGVVHRDVKPGNVLVGRDGRAKLADFGVARLVGQQSHQTRTGVVVGSVHYLAPEQVAFQEITPAVDVYALGLLLLRAITGHHAFDGGSTVESALARLTADPEVPDELPFAWRDLLRAMTARDPLLRPRAATVAARLRTLAGERATAPVAVAAAGPAREGLRARDLTGDVRLRVAALLPRLSASTMLAAALFVASVLLVTTGVETGAPVAASERPAASGAAASGPQPGADRTRPVSEEVAPEPAAPATSTERRGTRAAGDGASGTTRGDGKAAKAKGKGKGKGEGGGKGGKAGKGDRGGHGGGHKGKPGKGGR